MSQTDSITTLFNSNETFRQVIAGKIHVQKFFTDPKYEKSRKAFMDVYERVIGKCSQDSLYQDESVAAAWLTKIRYNENMSDVQFKQLIDRSEKIFKGPTDSLDLKDQDPEKNDLCAIMWGIEALNGVQSYDLGATRVRLPPNMGPKIVHALENGGSAPRTSTHATCTKLVDKGLGKDIPNENLRAFTPRGMGALLVVPTSPDGKGGVASASDKITSNIQGKDYDLLLKEEDYGYNDTEIHTHVHSKRGFVNYLTQHKKQYTTGMNLLFNKSTLAKKAERQHGEGEQIHRKEHLSELKEQSAALVSLLDAGKKDGLFNDFKTTWTIRIKWPPWEKKIVSADPNSRKGLGDFLYQLSEENEKNQEFAKKNAKQLGKVKDLLEQARDEKSAAFQKCREGNEVLVDCSSGKAILLDNINKNTSDVFVDRDSLAPLGMISEVNPDLQKDFKDQVAIVKGLDTTTVKGLDTTEAESIQSFKM